MYPGNMSLLKSIASGKEHRQLYFSGKAMHDSRQCAWCRDNRLHRNHNRLMASEEHLEEALIEEQSRDKTHYEPVLVK